MRRTCLILTLVALLAGVAFAGHGLNSPVATTNPGDFWVSGNMDLDGTGVFDGVCTFNANAIFTLDVSIGGDLTVTDDASCDSLYVGTNATVGDTLTVGGALKGGRVFLQCGSHVTAQTTDVYLGLGSGTAQLYPVTERGFPVACGGSVLGTAMCVNVLSYTPGATIAATIYVNTGAVFTATWTVDATGPGSWYATQPRGVDTFSAGDVFTVLCDVTGTVEFHYPIATVDLQLDD